MIIKDSACEKLPLTCLGFKDMAFLVPIMLSLLLLCLQVQRSLCLVEEPEIERLNFFALGDWGGLPWGKFNYSTAVERAVADEMGRLADQLEPSFVIALGDNFYFTGVDDVEDERFFQTFENIFTSPSLDIPWQVCAGNHDHYGNVSAEIAYTDKSTRWNFPDFYHTRTWTIPGTSSTVELVLIDTVILCGNTEADDSEVPPKGPKSAIEAERQWTWIENTLKNSKADYLLVGGHFPVWSAGMHGNTDCLVQRLKPLLEEYKVTAYLAGHDHNIQHIDDGTGVHYFVTGCATFVQDWQKNKDNVPEGSLKFFWADDEKLGGFTAFVATPTRMIVSFIAGTGKVLYVKILRPRHYVMN